MVDLSLPAVDAFYRNRKSHFNSNSDIKNDGVMSPPKHPSRKESLSKGTSSSALKLVKKRKTKKLDISNDLSGGLPTPS